MASSELITVEAADPRTAALAHLRDERLELLFACCHPALALEAQVALTSLRRHAGHRRDRAGIPRAAGHHGAEARPGQTQYRGGCNFGPKSPLPPPRCCLARGAFAAGGAWGGGVRAWCFRRARGVVGPGQVRTWAPPAGPAGRLAMHDHAERVPLRPRCVAPRAASPWAPGTGAAARGTRRDRRPCRRRRGVVGDF